MCGVSWSVVVVVVVNQGWQSEASDGLKGGWVFLSFCLSFSLSLCVFLSPSIYRATFLAIYLSTCLFMYLLNCLSFCLSSHSSIHLLLSVSFFSVHLYIDPCPHLFITMFFVLFLYRFIHASVRLPLLPAIHPSSYSCVYLVIDASCDLAIYESICLSIWSPIFRFISRCIYGFCDASICLSIYRSIYPCIYRFSHPIPLYLSPVVFQKTTAARAPTASFSFVDVRLHDASRAQNGC